MLKKSRLSLVLLSTIAVLSCSDNGGRDLVKTPNHCITERDCPSGICLINGRCAELVLEGDECNESHRCGIGLECRDGVCVSNANIQCISNSHCASGLCLANGSCAIYSSEGELCDSSHICLNGLECVDKRCAAILPEICRSNADCPVGYSCESGACVIQSNWECESSQDCDVSYICRNHQCVPPDDPKGCLSNNDCPSNYLCRNYQCVPPDNPVECMSNNDCSGGYICKEHQCVPPDDPVECMSNSDCALDYICLSNRCVPSETPVECMVNADCADGFFCLDNQCVWGNCAVDSDCKHGFKCEKFHCEIPTECQTSEDCADGWACLDGACATYGWVCYDQSECPDDMVCKNYHCEEIEVCDPADLSPEGDYDRDGILNGVEIDAGLDPCDLDTDGDGYLDGIEDSNHNGIYEPELGETNPLDPSDPPSPSTILCEYNAKYQDATTGHYRYINVAKEPNVRYSPGSDDLKAKEVRFEGDGFAGFFGVNKSIQEDIVTILEDAVVLRDLQYNVVEVPWKYNAISNLYLPEHLIHTFKFYLSFKPGQTLQDIVEIIAGQFGISGAFVGAEECQDSYGVLSMTISEYDDWDDGSVGIFSVIATCEHESLKDIYYPFADMVGTGMLVSPTYEALPSASIPLDGLEAFRAKNCDLDEIVGSYPTKINLNSYPVASTIIVFAKAAESSSSETIEVPYNALDYGWRYDIMNNSITVYGLSSLFPYSSIIQIGITYNYWWSPYLD